MKTVSQIKKRFSFPQSIPQGEYIALEWRKERPVWDKEKCFKCGICYLSCPDAAIHLVEDGLFEADLEVCKGCGICARECWNGTISMIAEEE
jgi:pyruvate ferredoxin oxidoreductase delta subunit